MIRVVQEVESGELVRSSEVHVKVLRDRDAVFVAREDYYEDGGICYSGIELTRDDLERMLTLLYSVPVE